MTSICGVQRLDPVAPETLQISADYEHFRPQTRELSLLQNKMEQVPFGI